MTITIKINELQGGRVAVELCSFGSYTAKEKPYLDHFLAAIRTASEAMPRKILSRVQSDKSIELGKPENG